MTSVGKELREAGREFHRDGEALQNDLSENFSLDASFRLAK